MSLPMNQNSVDKEATFRWVSVFHWITVPTLFSIFVTGLLFCAEQPDISATPKSRKKQKPSRKAPNKKANTLPKGVRCLLKAYPKKLSGFSNNTITWTDGSSMPYGDTKETKVSTKKRTHQEILNTPSLKDQLSQRYPVGRSYAVPPPKNHDPGRIRYEPFFKKMYGKNVKEVRRHLTTIRWMKKTFNHSIQVTKINEVHKKLQSISDMLDQIDPRIKTKYLKKKPGTFVPRRIKGTQRLSVHSFGIAIDIAVSHADYWRWDHIKPDGKLGYKNQIPLEIVEAFEKEGFIWGGKWYHYDTMHFEYRPELLVSPCAALSKKTLQLK